MAKSAKNALRRDEDRLLVMDGGDAREERFEQLFERYSRSVSYFFAHRGFTLEECRDLTQETFLGVYRGMDRFRHDSSIETWLFTIAANVWRNEVRNRSAEKRDGYEISVDGPKAVVLPDDDDPLDGLLDEERRENLRQALESLPHQMRRCLVLRIDQQLKYREIADLLQISIQTVKSQLFQARERLKQKLG